MTQDDMNTIIQQCTRNTLNMNRNVIEEFTKSFIETHDNTNPYVFFSEMIVSFCEKYMYLSAANTLSLLNALGLFDPQNCELLNEKPSLKVVWDSDKKDD